MNFGNALELLHCERGVVISPWVTSDGELSNSVLEDRSRYADYLEGLLSGYMQNEPMYLLMHYKSLPDSYLDKELVTPYAVSKSCGYYIGKKPCYRNFESWLRVADAIIVGIDLGMSRGMVDILTNWAWSKKVYYVSIYHLGRISKIDLFKGKEQEDWMKREPVIDLVACLLDDKKALVGAFNDTLNKLSIHSGSDSAKRIKVILDSEVVEKKDNESMDTSSRVSPEDML